MAPVAQFLLQWADSEVARVAAEGADVLIHLAAAQVLPVADAGSLGGRALGHVERAVGHVRHLVLRLTQAEVDPTVPLGDAIGRLALGRLRLGDGPPACTLAVPCQHPGPAHLSLAFANGTQLDISAAGLQAGFSGDPAYRPSLAC